MTLSQSALLDLLDALNASDGVDVIRSAVQVMLQDLIEAEATALIGAQPHERTEARTVQRNGHRLRTLSTAAGDLELAILKLRAGSFFPSLLERRRELGSSFLGLRAQGMACHCSLPPSPATSPFSAIKSTAGVA